MWTKIPFSVKKDWLEEWDVMYSSLSFFGRQPNSCYNILILLCCIMFDRIIGCSSHCSTNAGFMQADVLLIAIRHTAQIWILSPFDLCCIQKQSMLIKLWDAAVWCDYWDSSHRAPLSGESTPCSFSSSDSTHPFTMITPVSTHTQFAFSSFTRSYRCWESDL